MTRLCAASDDQAELGERIYPTLGGRELCSREKTFSKVNFRIAFRERASTSSAGRRILFREHETAPVPRRGGSPVRLSGPFAVVLDDYTAALKRAALSDQTRRTYASKVRQFLAWLADADTAGEALRARDARDWAVRDYRSHLQTVLKRKPATVNNALAAVDDLYIRRGLGPASAARAELPRRAEALSTRAAVRFLREVQKCQSPRDRAIALVPFYAGTRIAEITGLRMLAGEAKQAAGLAGEGAPRVTDRSTSISTRLRQLNRSIAGRTGHSKELALRLTGEAGTLAARSLREARRLAAALRQRARGRGAQANCVPRTDRAGRRSREQGL
jgi:site-specific recombinase XerC